MTSITVHTRSDGLSLLVVCGGIDAAHANTLEATGLKLIAAYRQGLLIDLLDVTFLDPSGLGCLITLRNAAFANNTGITLLDPSPAVTSVLSANGAAEAFHIKCTSTATDRTRDDGAPPA
jgi:anti-anti-sigma factor